MKMESLPTKRFSGVQLELLKLYSTELKEEDLLELKRVLASHFGAKAADTADEEWERRGLSNTDMDAWLHGKPNARGA